MPEQPPFETGTAGRTENTTMKLASRIAFASLLLVACGSEVVVVDGNGNPVPTDGSGNNPVAVPVVPKTPAAKVAINQIAVYQGVKIPVFAEGERIAERNAPVVAGRPGVIRVFVSPAADFTPTKIAGVLTVKAADGKVSTFKDSRMVRAVSSDASATSTLNFDLPGEAFAVDATFSVTLTDDLGQGEGSPNQIPVRYPAGEAFDPMDVQATGSLKVVVVPVRYDVDPLQRLPDTSEAQVEVFKKTLMGLYPASSVTVTVREPFAWSTAIAANGQGWDTVLNAMISLRRRDRVADDVYYYGVFSPQSNFESFCRRGCVTGLSGLVDNAADSFLRASVGLGFTGAESAGTMAHELGHAHGREHAPCGGAGGPDRQFPYRGGTIGTWGYNIITKQYISPSIGTDMMGYCDEAWVSDYTYSALFNRVVAVSGGGGAQAAQALPPASAGGSAFRIVSFDGDGVATSSESLSLSTTPKGTESEVEYLGDAGRVVARAKGHVYKYDHLPGGMVIMPEQTSAYSQLRVGKMTRVMNLKGILAH
jgi:hypothetical protein